MPQKKKNEGKFVTLSGSHDSYFEALLVLMVLGFRVVARRVAVRILAVRAFRLDLPAADAAEAGDAGLRGTPAARSAIAIACL